MREARPPGEGASVGIAEEAIAARVHQAHRQRFVETHTQLRRVPTMLQSTALFALFAVLPLIPGAREVTGVPFAATLTWALVHLTVMWTMVAIARTAGVLSRAYLAGDIVESLSFGGGATVLVGLSGRAASIWWALYFVLCVFVASQGAYRRRVDGAALSLDLLVGASLLYLRSGRVSEALAGLGIGSLGLVTWSVISKSAIRGDWQSAERDLLRERVVELERERERARIAHELHDSLGADLNAIALLSESAVQQVPAASASLRPVIDRARSAVAEVRAAVWAARGGPASASELADHLRQVGQSIATPSGAEFSLALVGDGVLGIEHRHHVLRIVQECTHNAVRHAAARKIEARLDVCNDALTLEVSDDGPGIPSDALAQGRGLAGAQRRARALGGTLELGPGARVRVRLPVHRGETAAAATS